MSDDMRSRRVFQHTFVGLGRRSRLLLSLLLLAALLLGGCRSPQDLATATPVVHIDKPVTTGLDVRGGALTRGEGVMPGMQFQLSEGSEMPSVSEPVSVAAAIPLSEGEIERLLARLPALEGEAGDIQAFRLPERSLPAPRPGETIESTFPPEEAAEGPEQPVVGPLKVLRYSPEGDVPLAPYLSVTFDQPMVALTAHADLAAQDVPVVLSPLPEGAWRWVGTKTLMFEPITRFPMATDYVVEIATGTTSANGGKLAEKVVWSFTTPPPQMQASYPTHGPHVRDPLLFVAFDQRIEPAAVLETISLRAGGKSFPLELATKEQVDVDETVSRMARHAGEGRWLAFRTGERLPYDTTVTVNIGPGTPSVEGPRTTQAVQSYSFTTYGPLQVVETRCGWGKECPPMSPWLVRFSNPLDAEAFDDSLVRIEPEIPGTQVSLFGSSLRIQGRSQGRTTYKVTLKADITDQFGQTLEKDEVVTFKVGTARPLMSVPSERFVVLDPEGSPTYSVFTINYGALRVRAYAVQPEDWPQYRTYLREGGRRENPPDPPGRRVMDTKVRIEGERDHLVETSVDLSELLKDGRGQVILVIEPEQGLVESLRNRGRPPVIRVWIQATNIALDAFVDGQEMIAWASALSDGAPLEGVKLELFPDSVSKVTGDDGLARLALKTGSDQEGGYLVARRGRDAAILPSSTSFWGGGWRRISLGDQFRWYVFDDRQMYRPGEEVHVKGWVRLAKISRGSEALGLPGTGSIFYELYDARGNRLLSDELTLNALGGFHTSFTLPAAMNLGYAQIRFRLTGRAPSASGREHSHQIQVQEFRRPEFEVSASTSEAPHFVGGGAIASVEAKYYAGGPLPNADVAWSVTSTPGSYSPPNWDDFYFGVWTPWWREYSWPGIPKRGDTRVQTYEGRTDAAGVHNLRIDFKSVEPPRPTTINAQATVMDVNRQAWTASTNLLVHPAELYVGLRSGRTFVERGQPIVVDAIVTDLDGKPVSGRAIEMRAVRLRWVFVKGSWKQEEADEQVCAPLSSDEPVSCTFETPEGGTYRITATIEDEQGRPNLTQITRWVSGGQRPTVNKVEQEEAVLIPDKREYQPGDTAEILVQSPFVPAEGLLTLRCNGLVVSERFHMDEATYTLRVPIEENHIPNIHIQVDLVGAAARLNSEGQADDALPQRPAYAKGNLNLSVPPYARTLSLEVTPREAELEPGGETVVDVRLTNAEGKAVQGAELAVVVVDEAVLALTNYQLADPLAAFYPQRSAGVSNYYLRRHVLLVDPDKLLEEETMGGAQLTRSLGMRAPAAVEKVEKAVTATKLVEEESAPGAGEESQPIRVRADFNPLATFEPATPTDADGTASVRVKLPDNLTRYRVMVVAVAEEKHFGKGESTITARLPLMVRPSPPRFLNFGDKFELPILLQNQTDEAMDVDVVVRATNIELTAGAGQRVAVPAKDRVEIRFPATTASVGTARFQVGASSGQWADAAEFDLPVYTPATTEAFAVYGTVDEGTVAQPVIAPSDAYPQFGGLEVSTSSTALQALTDAVLYLTKYPYMCSEQLASRILAVAALRDVLSAFEAEGLPEPEELVKAVQRDIKKLQGMQNPDGGFPVWRRGRESWPFHSIHAAHALARAGQKGFQVPKEMTSHSLSYLREIESHYPRWYSYKVRNTLTAYALYVRAQMGDRDPSRARRLTKDAGLANLQPEAVGWLLSVLADDPASTAELAEIRRYLDNRVVETAGAAHFATSYQEKEGYLLLASNRRADGIILEGLMLVDPDSDLIPKIVRGLLAHRKRGRWGNTQENVFILLALDRYFNVYEAQTPDFVARVWLGDQYVAGFEFRGRSTDYQAVTVPMSYLVERKGTQDLILSKEGDGRLYYRLGLSYAPTSLELAPMDQGFAVERSYEGVDDPADVTQDEHGVWHVKAGTRVRVRLTMVAPTRRYHVALVDPLPAGFETLNPALAVTGSIPQDPGDQGSSRYWWWRWTWYEHQNLRDERAEAFASLLWDGIHTYTYVVRATTPGEFVVPPPKAEEMYSPEVFGRGGTDRVLVE